MDTSPHTRAPRRTRVEPADGAAEHDGRAHDAFWWVVLYQGALDYTRSIGPTEHDAEAATRLVDSYPSLRRP